MCTVLLPPGGYPIAVNIYIYIYIYIYISSINLLNNVTMSRHVGKIGVTVQNYVHEEINSRLFLISN